MDELVKWLCFEDPEEPDGDDELLHEEGTND